MIIMKSKKILFIKRGNTTFENIDFEILSKHYQTKIYIPNFKNTYKGIKLIFNSDLLYYWFPGDYKFLFTVIAKLFRKKILVVGGGQMSTADSKTKRRIATVKYRPFYILLGKISLKLADRIIAVSDYEKKGISRYINSKKIQLIYNTYNTSLFKQNNIVKVKNLVITISTITKSYYKRKGLDIFVELSKIMPEFEFVIIGKDSRDGTSEMIKKMNVKNLKLTGYLGNDELLNYIYRANIYCQFSKQEGFGVALAEAQACGCIPIVSSHGAITEVAGPKAFYISDQENYTEIARKVISASNSSQKLRKEFSLRIKNLYGNNGREKAIIDMIENMFQ
jgi:glycosyltransferase involved in cell wall biosynthesis